MFIIESTGKPYINPETGNAEMWDEKPEGYLTWEEYEALEQTEPEPEPVPDSVTARQGFIYLHRIKALNAIESKFEYLPENEKIEAKIEWEKVTVIERANPLVQKIKALMEWTDEDLDTMFIEANKI